MADFLYCRGPAPAELARAMQSCLGRAALSFAPLIEEGDGRLLWRTGAEPSEDSFWRADEASWILRSGMFSHRATAGTAGLKSFYESFDPANPDLTECRGQFTLLIKKAGALHLLSDALGTNKIYYDKDQHLFSTLFVAVAEGLKAPRIDPQGCYEYAWNGVPSGERSFFVEMRSLPAGRVAVIADGKPVDSRALLPPDLTEDIAVPAAPMAEVAARQGERLSALMDETCHAFGDQVNLLVSGGYDSRLLLALLLKIGVRPRLTVYGSPGEPDYEIVRQIADGENLDFFPVDKSTVPPPPEVFADTVLADYAAFDGWKVTGLFDSGSDRRDRLAQATDGWNKMNGSLGEIYRNFFYLPDRPFWARDLVRSFYARYDPQATTRVFDATAYEKTIAEAIVNAVGADSPRLTRRQVELAYPLFRGRYWTAREVPLNQGFGGYLTPFMEPTAILGTPDWPIAWKSHGLIEGEMIAQLSPRLAAYPSAYGRPLNQPPSWQSRMRAQATYRRPIWLRRLSYRLQQNRQCSRPLYLSPAHLAAVMDGEFPYMRALFKLDRVTDEDAFNRIATLEFLCQRYQAKQA